MDKENILHAYNGILFNLKKKKEKKEILSYVTT